MTFDIFGAKKISLQAASGLVVDSWWPNVCSCGHSGRDSVNHGPLPVGGL